jgi:PadR family transcriptional regulator AphA
MRIATIHYSTMRTATSSVRTTTFAILGLLSIRRQASGYDLTAFADLSIGQFWPMHRSLVYRELARLEADGYVSATDVAQERVPDKRVYALTEAGTRELDAWLATPGFERPRYKNEFLVKFFFARRMSTDRLRELLDDYRATLEEDTRDLKAIVEKTKPIPGSLFGRLAALHGIRQYEALLGWIGDVEDALAEAGAVHESNASPSKAPPSPVGRAPRRRRR